MEYTVSVTDANGTVIYSTDAQLTEEQAKTHLLAGRNAVRVAAQNISFGID